MPDILQQPTAKILVITGLFFLVLAAVGIIAIYLIFEYFRLSIKDAGFGIVDKKLSLIIGCSLLTVGLWLDDNVYFQFFRCKNQAFHDAVREFNFGNNRSDSLHWLYLYTTNSTNFNGQYTPFDKDQWGEADPAVLPTDQYVFKGHYDRGFPYLGVVTKNSPFVRPGSPFNIPQSMIVVHASPEGQLPVLRYIAHKHSSIDISGVVYRADTSCGSGIHWHLYFGTKSGENYTPYNLLDGSKLDKSGNLFSSINIDNKVELNKGDVLDL